ncbi:MAG: sensor histidine kinase N-terminal domain-containing protein [Salinisphaera sp.]|nr:sensor histidine kinase N-terminal domain-containing protein [Salinisphaera sp.]
MLVFLLVDAVVTYFVALSYANHVHDRDLADDALTLATMLRTQAPDGQISPQARFLLEFDPDGHNYFSIRSVKQGLIAGSKRLRPITRAALPGQPPTLYNENLNRQALRLATLAIANPHDKRDVLDITVAQDFRGREQVAQHILFLSVSLQLALIVALLILVWLGVRFGLRVIDPLTRRLSRREHDLSPIDDDDVPVELLPLTKTIDDLFARVNELLKLQERFIADAAHQLRTPLAGLRLHIDRALRFTHDERAREALEQIERLTDRTTRTSTQLLALSRAQARPMQMAAVNLRTLVPDLTGQRVPDTIERDIDLGFETTDEPAWVRGDAIALQQALDNLIDNALRYTPRGGTVTLTLATESRQWLCLQVEDSGPGVDSAALSRLGERFFRAPGNQHNGTGLGLAIVQHIVRQHAGKLQFRRSVLGGLSVTIYLQRLPAESDSAAAVGAGT